MGFYLRKSISVGPLRFNLSKSGVGVSAGVPGFRVGMGPRGNYVHMGREGLYYRSTLGGPSSPSRPAPSPPAGTRPPPIPAGTHEELAEIESGDVSEMVDSSSRALLEELNKKVKTSRLFPVVAGACVIALVYALIARWPAWAILAVFAGGAIAIYLAQTRDALKRTAVLFYDLDPEMGQQYERLHGAASDLAACSAAWHIEASGNVIDRKYHAGANSLVRRSRTSINKVEPPFLKTNIETVSVQVGKQRIYFFPDRALVVDGTSVGAVGYSQLKLNVSTVQFVEGESVPGDAKVVGRTWKYVNKSGGPDRRFKDNVELPICQYEEIAMSSSTGLNEIVQLSRCGPGQAFAAAIAALATALPAEGRSGG